MSSERDIVPGRSADPVSRANTVDLDQILERLEWTPAERLRYLLDMLDFEEKAHRAKQVNR